MQAEIFNFQSYQHFYDFVRVCKEIAGKDATFRFFVDDVKRKVYINHDNADELHKKCLWLIHRVDKTGKVVYYAPPGKQVR